MRQNSMQIDRYLQILGRRKLLLLLPVVLSLIGAAVLASRAPLPSPQQYEATATVRLALAGGSANATEAIVIVNSANYVLESDSTLRQVAQDLGINASPGRLRNQFEIEQIRATEFLEIHARGSSPEAARDLANALANMWPTESAQIYSELDRAELAKSFSIYQQADLGTAVPNSLTAETSWVARIAIALAVGLVGGLGIVLVTEYTDRTINSLEDVALSSPASVLSSIPRLKRKGRLGRAAHRSPAGQQMAKLKEIRLLTAQLMHVVRARRLRSILFISIWPRDGTTSIASNTAISLAGNEFDVLLVDGNLENPTLHNFFENADLRPGLTDVLASGAGADIQTTALAKAVQDSRYPGLSFLTSGSPIPDAWATLTSIEMRRFIESYSRDEGDDPERRELMIIDGPSLAASANALTLASVVGGVVVVCAEGSGTTDDLQRGLIQLDSLGANILGVIYNKAKMPFAMPLQAAEPFKAAATQFGQASRNDDDGVRWPQR